MTEYSVLIFERESFLAEVLEAILKRELRDHRLSIQTVGDFSALQKELSMQHYDVVLADLLNWNDEDYTGFRTATEAFPDLRVMLAGNGSAIPAFFLEHPNTVITPSISTHISGALLEMLSGSHSGRS